MRLVPNCWPASPAAILVVQFCLAGQSPPANIGAMEAARPVDAADGGVGAVAGVLEGVAERADVEHPPAGGAQRPVGIAAGPGVEDGHHVLERPLGAADDRA